VFIFSHEREQGVFAQQKAENCSFAQNVVTRLRVVPLSLSLSCVTRKKTAIKKKAARSPRGKKQASRSEDFTWPFSGRGFLSCHARQTKRKRDYS